MIKKLICDFRGLASNDAVSAMSWKPPMAECHAMQVGLSPCLSSACHSCLPQTFCSSKALLTFGYLGLHEARLVSVDTPHVVEAVQFPRVHRYHAYMRMLLLLLYKCSHERLYTKRHCSGGIPAAYVLQVYHRLRHGNAGIPSDTVLVVYKPGG